MHRRWTPLAVLLAIVLLGPTLVGAQDTTTTPAASDPLSAGTALASTDVRYFLPYGPDGLKTGLTATATVDGVCGFASSAALGRPDAWDCLGSDDQVYDPCFENPVAPPDEGGELACVASPFTADVVLLTTTEPLIRQKELAAGPDSVQAPGSDQESAGAMALPWAVELANGQRCTIVVGQLDVLAGQTLDYACADGGAILGQLDRTRPVWSASFLAADAVATTTIDLVATWL